MDFSKNCFLFLLLASLANASFQASTAPQLDDYLSQKLPDNVFLKGSKGSSLRKRYVRVMQEIIAKGGCNPNVCFALDGSGSVTKEQYVLQKEFVELASVLIGVDKSAHFAAVQYGLRLEEISPLTHKQNQFLLRVGASKALSAPRTFIAGGLAYCVRQLKDRVEDANKLVLLGDGRNNFGSGIPTSVLTPLHGEVCAVAVGDVNRHVLEKITGSSYLVFNPHDYFALADIVDALVSGLCHLQAIA